MTKITAQKTNFIDERGRARIFNGYNFAAKDGGADKFAFDLDDAFLEKFASLGFNVIRLAVVWENLEPEPGRYNERYLQSIDGIFDRAAQHGIYVFLDMHQDLYCNFPVTGGDGAPQWAVLAGGAKPRKTRVVWAENYMLHKGVRNAFDNFWANAEVHGRGLQDHFAALWQMLAKRYGNHPALFGFDLLNEPFGGSLGAQSAKKLAGSIVKNMLFNPKIDRKTVAGDLIHKDRRWHFLDNFPGEVVPDITQAAARSEAEFSVKRYTPFLRKIAAAIRKETSGGFIMMEQSIFSNAGVPMAAPPITVNGKREPLQCYSPHSYDLTVDTAAYKYANNSRVGAFFTQIAKTQDRLDVPVLVGEWGGFDVGTAADYGHAQFLLNFFDAHRWSQTYWTYIDGQLESTLMGVLSRPHPIAVSGEIQSYHYDWDKQIFTLNYTQSAEITAPTEIYIHKPSRAVIGDGEVSIAKKYDSGAAILHIAAKPGAQRFEVQF